MRRTFGNILADIKSVLGQFTGEAVHAAHEALAELESKAASVRTEVTDLVAQAKTDIEAAVAAAEPGIKTEVGQLVAKLEADLEAALADLAVHGL